MNVKIYVNVIIPIPISNDISYVVPNNLIDKIEIGKRVLVPFGKTKTRIAFIKEILYDTNFDFELKEILEVLDDYTILSHKHLEFWSWISKYYLTPIGIVMKMAVLSTLLKKENIHFESNNRINRSLNNENILSQAQQIA